MEKEAKIYVAGHRGMVGSAICRELGRQGYTNLITRTHQELDLTRQKDVEDFFREEKPDYVFLASAKVGGIVANEEAGGLFVYQHGDGDECHPRGVCEWLQEVGILRFLLHLSPDGAAADEGELSLNIGAGKNK